MLRLQLLQPPQHLVELEVADLRLALVVEAVVAVERFAELLDLFSRVHAAVLNTVYSCHPYRCFRTVLCLRRSASGEVPEGKRHFDFGAKRWKVETRHAPPRIRISHPRAVRVGSALRPWRCASVETHTQKPSFQE